MVGCLARRPWPLGPVGWTVLLALLTIAGGDRVGALEPSTRISQYRHQRWAQENGLPRNTVNDIAQTGDGYLWVATGRGLARFNGAAFTVFNRDTTPGLRANQIGTLQTARDGSLWLGFRAGFGIARLQNGLIDPDPQGAGVTNHTVLHLCEDREGAWWIGGGGDPPNLSRLKAGKLASFDASSGWPGGSVREIHQDPLGQIWVASSSGLFLWRNGVFTNFALLPGYAHTNTYCVCTDNEGGLWAGTEAGVARFAHGRFTTYTTSDGLSNDRVESLFKDRDGNVWIGTSWGLSRWNALTRSLESSPHPETFDAVLCFCEDREGNLWIGTEYGLHLLSDTRFVCFGPEEGLRYLTTFAVCQDRATNLWVGTWSGGAYRLGPERLDHFTSRDGLSGDVVTSVYADPRGAVWLGTRHQGVTRHLDGVFTPFAIRGAGERTVVHAIYEDRRQELWLGTSAGPAKWDGAGFRVFSPPGLRGKPEVYCLRETPEGDLWIATSQGLWRRQGDSWQEYTTADGLPANPVYCLYQEATGRFWAGTRFGLAYWTGGRWQAAPCAQPLANRDVYWMTEDSLGGVYCGSAWGIWTVRQSDLDALVQGKLAALAPVAFDASDGLASGQCRHLGGPTGCKDARGRLWFATVRGLAMTHPERYRSNTLSAPVVIERLTADGAPRSLHAPIRIGAEVKRLQIDYAALSYRNREKIRFKTRLEGWDDSWSAPLSETRQTYSGLGPGRYVFQAIACNDDGLWQETGPRLAFEVLPPFYRAGWFYWAVGAGLAGLGWSGHRWRVRHLHRREQVLTALVNERTRTLQAEVAERLKVEAQLLQAQKMDAVGQLAAGVAHDFNNLLSVIQGNASLLRESGPASEPETEESLSQIIAASERAAELTRQLLTFSRRNTVHRQPLDLNGVLANLAKILRRVLGEPITLEVQSGLNLPVILADRGLIEQAIMNLAVNARDAMSKGGRLLLRSSRVELTPGTASACPEARPGLFACLEVADEGCGMDPATLQRVFEPFFTTKEIGKGTGLGLSAVYGIVKQHGGWIQVASSTGRGAVFTIFLPACSEPLPPPAPPLPSTRSPRGSETILVVEDDPDVRALVRNSLRKLGYTVLEAQDGLEALEIWKRRRQTIHLLITDMVMPKGMNGRELAERLAADQPQLIIIYTSGYALELAPSAATLHHGARFLQKPYPADVLARVVRESLDQPSSRWSR